MRRFSVRTLMAVVLVSAVGLAALRNANEFWSGMMLLLALAAVGVAVLGAILMRGRERAWWLGFVVFGGGYLLAAVCPVRSELATTRLFEYVHARVVGSEIATFEVSRLDVSSVLYRAVTSDEGVTAKTITNRVYESTPAGDLLASMAPANRWRSALPGAANHDPFLRVGHCLFALLAGLIGGTVAAWFDARRERVGRDAESLRHSPQHARNAGEGGG